MGGWGDAGPCQGVAPGEGRPTDRRPAEAPTRLPVGRLLRQVPLGGRAAQVRGRSVSGPGPPEASPWCVVGIASPCPHVVILCCMSASLSPLLRSTQVRLFRATHRTSVYFCHLPKGPLSTHSHLGSAGRGTQGLHCERARVGDRWAVRETSEWEGGASAQVPVQGPTGCPCETSPGLAPPGFLASRRQGRSRARHPASMLVIEAPLSLLSARCTGPSQTLCACVFVPRGKAVAGTARRSEGPGNLVAGPHQGNLLSADPKITDAASWSRRGDLGSAPHGPGAPEAAHRISFGSSAPQARGAGTPRAPCSGHLGSLEARTGPLPSRIMEEETEAHGVRGTHPRANGKVVPELGPKPGPPVPPKHQVCGWSAPRPGPAPWRLCVGLTDREVQQCPPVRGRRSPSGACLQGL